MGLETILSEKRMKTACDSLRSTLYGIIYFILNSWNLLEKGLERLPFYSVNREGNYYW
jgi:hypothetical protein